jgi:protocatechuate 4,5-dioxygenase beta chain
VPEYSRPNASSSRTALLVNVIQYPQPTAARCYALGQAIGRALASYDLEVTVGILGTGGMSHQLAGARAGFINPEFDAMWLEAIEQDPAKLAALTREELIRLAGSEGIELIMWLIMRGGAMNDRIARVHETYFVPASNTAAALALFDNRAAALR